MNFGDPVVGGETLIRAAIRSPNYVTGVSGWTINADGSAEFNDVDVRGDLLVIEPSNNNFVSIQANGTAAVIYLYPGDISGLDPVAAELYANFDPGPPDPNDWVQGQLNIQSPTGTLLAAPSTILMRSASVDGLVASSIDVVASNVVLGTYARVDATMMRLNSRIVATREAGIFTTVLANDTTTSGTFVNMAGAGNTTSFTLVKEHDETDVRLDMACYYNDTTGVTNAEFALRIDSVDYPVANDYAQLGTNRRCAAGFNYTGAGAVPAGTYTVQARWRRQAGTGTMTRGVGSSLSISAREVSAAA
jgi:hypothetical protein